jgi:nucleoid-associated protein YgaU
MPRDAKLGLVVGVALVIVIAVLFFHNSGTAGTAGNLGAAVSRGAARASAGSWFNLGPMPGLAPLPAPRGVRSHTVQEGETLSSLAVRYYGDASHSTFLFRANRSQLRAPDQVPVGTVLLIPDLPAPAAER